MILACSLVLPAPSSSQGRNRAKKAQAAVKSEDEDMQAGLSTSQPDSASQQEAEMDPSQQEAEMEVAAVLTAGVDMTEDADETAVPLLDRLAGMLMHMDCADPVAETQHFSIIFVHLPRYTTAPMFMLAIMLCHNLFRFSPAGDTTSTAINLITAQVWLLEAS